jgi:acetyltransferase-like isoleucine patch superfamily enzyme
MVGFYFRQFVNCARLCVKVEHTNHLYQANLGGACIGAGGVTLGGGVTPGGGVTLSGGVTLAGGVTLFGGSWIFGDAT